MVNTHGLMRLGAIQRIAEIEIELNELRAIVKSPAQPTTTYRTTKRATADDRPTRESKRESKRLHWMQRPENADKIAAMHRKGRRTRKKNHRAD